MRRAVALLVLAVGCAALPPAVHHPPIVLGAAPAPPMIAPSYPFADAVVRLRHDGMFRCSAVAVSARRALTAAHCIPDEPAVITIGRDGHPPVTIAAVHEHAELDIAVLELASPIAGPFALTGPAPEHFDPLFIVGYGCGKVFLGGDYISNRGVRPLHFLLTAPDSIAQPPDLISIGLGCTGDSGGGLFDALGRLVGINVAVRDETATNPPIVRSTDVRAADAL